jgi:predicted TIM-barrel fold metal-dependent hydrolase
MRMLTRRNILIGAAVTGVATLTRSLSSSFAENSPHISPINFKVPAGACDCHTHIFGDPRRFPFSPSRTYTPEPATVEEMRDLHRALHTERVVIVQPSVYGTENACLLDAIKQVGAGARGVAVIDGQTSEAALDEMYRSGIRGIRLNLQTAFQADPAAARQLFQGAAERVKTRKWHIQIYARLAVIQALKDLVMAAPVPIVFDHFGGAQASLGVGQPGFDALLDVVQKGKAYVKISAPYRSSTQAPDYPDAAPLAKALIAANPRRVLWGTDWPHPDSASVASRKATDLAPRLKVDDGSTLNLLPVWVPEAAKRTTILVDNPAKLYGF